MIGVPRDPRLHRSPRDRTRPNLVAEFRNHGPKLIFREADGRPIGAPFHSVQSPREALRHRQLAERS